MGNFGRDNRGGGFSSRGRSNYDRGDRGGRSGFSRGGDRQMHQATCSNCGKDCEVPFRPTNGKPVYCSDCFEKMGGGRSDAPRNDFRSPSPTSNQNNIQLDAVNAKLDKILAILEPKKVKEVKEVKTPKVRKVVKKSSVKK